MYYFLSRYRYLRFLKEVHASRDHRTNLREKKTGLLAIALTGLLAIALTGLLAIALTALSLT